jgi:Fe2+ transport system protein FeoA
MFKFRCPKCGECHEITEEEIWLRCVCKVSGKNVTATAAECQLEATSPAAAQCPATPVAGVPFCAAGEKLTPLTELQTGETGVICRVGAGIRNLKKFADVGFIKGETVKLENRAPFGGLLRVGVMGASISLHRDEAKYIFVRQKTPAKKRYTAIKSPRRFFDWLFYGERPGKAPAINGMKIFALVHTKRLSL